jgi:hypothetical protein
VPVDLALSVAAPCGVQRPASTSGATGTASTRLVVVRGNSGSGKSALAAAIRRARPRGVAVLGQDQLRREVLHVRDEPGSLAVDYLDLSARFALDHGLHVVLEGILRGDVYGDMLRRLLADHVGTSRCYRYELSFQETLRRDADKGAGAGFGEAQLRSWWREDDALHGVAERRIGPDSALHQTVRMVLGDCGWG